MRYLQKMMALVALLASAAAVGAAERRKPIVPASDPNEPDPPKLVASTMSTHPRLLFGPNEIPKLRRLAKEEGKAFFRQMEDYLPACKAPEKPGFLKDATDGQRVGLWRMPTAALHYVLSGEEKSLARAKGYMELLLALDHWETTRERDSGMSSANILIGAALCYDWLHDELGKAFREKFRRKLLTMARRQYYGGHLNRNGAVAYWQGDPANNHRWHRNAGMVLATLAAYEGDKDDDWLLARCFDEMELVNRWLPPDGTSHEGPSYLIFGGAHLTLACQAADRCFGTTYLRGTWFRTAPRFRLHTLAGGFDKSLHFGDSAGMGSYNNFLWKCAAVHGLADVQAGLRKHFEANPKAWWLGWMSMVWFQPMDDGSVDDLTRASLFPDVGLATMRDRWDEDGVVATFKCGPLGGYRLNAYRNARNYKYVNVAHDDPDAASFTIFARGEFLAETDRYSRSKRSANHNTILINGAGQTVRGRKEGGVWSQPGRGDMSKMAVLTAWKQAGDVIVVEGEAAGAYPAIAKIRPGLERFRRTMIWAKDRYILVLDDVRAPEDVEICWLVQGPRLTAEKEVGRYVLSKGEATCPFSVHCLTDSNSRIVKSPADHRGKALGWQQLRLTTRTSCTRLVSVYDPWGVGLSLTLKPGEGKQADTVTVEAEEFKDRWTWPAAGEGFSPTALVGWRGDRKLVEVSASDRPPLP